MELARDATQGAGAEEEPSGDIYARTEHSAGCL
jgi:hypothetical protein